MSEAEKYTNKENAKESLRLALIAFIKAANALGMDDAEIAGDIMDVVAEIDDSIAGQLLMT